MLVRWPHSQICWAPEGGEGGGEADPPRDPPRQTPAPTRAPEQQPQGGGRYNETIADVRAEAAARRVQANELRDQLKEANERADALTAQIESAKTTAVAPLTAKLEKAQGRIIDATLAQKMVAAGLQDADLIVLASRMPNAPKVTLDENFEVVGADEMVEAFKKWKPEFFKKKATEDAGGGGGGGGRAPTRAAGGGTPTPTPTGSGGEPTPSGGTGATSVKDMTPEQYKAYKARTLGDFRRAGAGAAGWGR